jgi:hypothetical protein
MARLSLSIFDLSIFDIGGTNVFGDLSGHPMRRLAGRFRKVSAPSHAFHSHRAVFCECRGGGINPTRRRGDEPAETSVLSGGILADPGPIITIIRKRTAGNGLAVFGPLQGAACPGPGVMICGCAGVSCCTQATAVDRVSGGKAEMLRGRSRGRGDGRSARMIEELLSHGTTEDRQDRESEAGY